MVTRKDLKQKFALISVYDKNKLKYLCSNLIKNSYLLISTGSTGDKIRSLGWKPIIELNEGIERTIQEFSQ